MTLRLKSLTLKAAFPVFAFGAYILSTELWVNFLLAAAFSTLHELGHLAFLRAFGSGAQSLTLGVMGVRLTGSTAALSYAKECAVALAGPLVNFVLAAVFLPLSHLSPVFTLPFILNAGLFIINMLPVRSFDGGRFLYSLLLMRLPPKVGDRVLSICEAAVLSGVSGVFILSLIFDFANASFVLFALCMIIMLISGMVSSKS